MLLADGLMCAHIRDLKWFFQEADGALGLKGQTYDPKSTADSEQIASAMADELIEKRLSHVERERRIRRALLRLHEETHGASNIRVIKAYCGQRGTPKWVRMVWGELSAVCILTETFKEYHAKKWFARMEADASKQRQVRLKIRLEALHLVHEALAAYAQCAPRRRV